MRKAFLIFIGISIGIISSLVSNGQTVIDFETTEDGYTSSSTSGSGSTDVFNRTNPNIGGNNTYIWAAEDISSSGTITLDQIDITGKTSFTFSIDMLTPNSNDWDSTDEMKITYSIDGGTTQNLLWVQADNDDDYNEPAQLDNNFDSYGDDGEELPAIDDDHNAGVGSNFETFTTSAISLSGNTELDITISFNGLTSGDEGIYLDDITITTVGGSSTPSITLSESSLTGFTYAEGSGPSSEQSFTASGENLTANISISAPTNYEISTSSGSGFGTSLTLTQSGGDVSETTIYVRLKSGLSVSSYNSENVTASSTGADSETVACSGSVFDVPDWCDLKWPESGNVYEENTFNVYAQIYESGVTNNTGQGSGVTCWIGYSDTNSDPSTWTNWVAATYNTDNGNNDEYVADIGSDISTADTYYYASRFSVDGTNYKYGGYNSSGGNFWDGTTYTSGTLTVNVCPTPNAPVATAGTSVNATSFTANWNSVTGADGYYLDVYTSGGTPTELINEDFESGQPTGWTHNSAYFNTGSAHGGTGKAGMNGIGDWVRTTALDSPEELKFWHRPSSSGSNPYSIIIQTSTDGTNWTDISTITHSGANTTYIEETINLGSNTSGTYVRFYMSAKSKSFYFDDVVITKGGGTTYVSGFENKDVSSVTSYSVTGLTTNTTYYYVVRAYNDCGNTSSNSNEIEVTPSAPANYADWCNLQSPASGTIFDDDSFNVYAQVYESGVTNASGQGSGVTCWIGYSDTNSDPSTWTNWVAATYNTDDGNNDEYLADLGSEISTPGTYYYASRFSVDGVNYSYGGYSSGGGNEWDGSSYVSGTLTVLACGTNHTITIDGDLSEWNDCEKFTDVTDVDTAFFTWDSNYIYIAFEGQEVGEDKQATYIFIDTDPNDFGALNGTSNAYAWGEYIEVPFYADYVVVCKNDLLGDYTEVKQWNGTTWQSVTLNSGDVNFSTSYSESPAEGTKEIRIKRATLGSPTNISLAWLTEEQFDDNYRNVAWPSEGWTDADRAADQKLCHYYGFELTTSIEPNNSSAYDKYCRVPCAPNNISFTTSPCDIEVDFVASNCSPTGYIALMYTDAAYSGIPANGTTYSEDDNISDGTYSATVKYIGTQTDFTVTGLSGSTDYYFDIYSYNNGSCSGWPIYSSALTGSSTTPASADAGDIFISEVAGKGHDANYQNEYIEISNPGSSSVDITDFVIKYYAGSSLEGSETLSGSIESDSAFFIATRTTHPGITPDQTFSPNISMNENFYVVLEDQCGNTIDQAGSSSDLFDDANNYEFTNCSGDNSSVSNWVNLVEENGTPGSINCITTNAEDGEGVVSVYNGSSDNLAGYDIWQRNSSEQIIVVDIDGESTDDLTNVSIEIPSAYTGLAIGNVSISGDAVVAGSTTGVVGNVITINGLELSSVNELSVEISDITTPSNNTVTDLGIDTVKIKTSIQGGTLTEISSQPEIFSTIPFANIKDYNSSTWALNNINKTVAVEGISTVASGRLSSSSYDQFFIQEGEGVNGRGLCIRSDDSFSPTLGLAKYFIIKGDIKLVRGSNDALTEVRANMTALSEPSEIINMCDTLLPEPYITSIDNLYGLSESEFENIDGILMRIQDASKLSGTWPSSNSSSANIQIKDASGSNDLRCYIFANTNIGGNAEPDWPVNMVTLVYNYDEDGDDVNDGVTERQITPIYYDNFFEEIVWDGSTGNTLWSDAQNWSPNLRPQKIDDVIFDNITGPTESYDVVLDARHQAYVRSITIDPDAGKQISLEIPESNTHNPALELHAEGNGIVINDGGVFVNNSGATTGNPVLWSSSGGEYPYLAIYNGGKYVHKTLRSSSNMTERLSTVAGTENGTFEYDLRSDSANFLISASGKTFGNLVFSANYGEKNYTITGASVVITKGNLQVNTGVIIDEVWSSTSKFTNEFQIGGNFIFNGDGWVINEENSLNNIRFNGSINQSIDIADGTFASGFNKDIVVSNAQELQLTTNLDLGEKIILENGNINLNGKTLQLRNDIKYVNGALIGDAFASISFTNTGNDTLIFSSGTAQLASLLINRGDATIILHQDLTINTNVNLTQGYLNTNTHILIISEGATVSGGSSNSFVDGNIRKHGSSSFEFPSGDIKQRDLNDDNIDETYHIYSPITLQPTSNGMLTVEYYFDEPIYDWWLHGGNLESTLRYVSSREYWNVSSTVDMGQVSLEWQDNEHTLEEPCKHGICPDNISGNFNFSDLVVSVYFDGMWKDLGQSSNTGDHNNGEITSELSVPSGSKAGDYVLTLGSLEYDVTLPVELISFNGLFYNKNVVLKWSTASEINNDYFDIEHSLNGISFSKLGKTKGAGNTSEQQDYQYIDNAYSEGLNYYRLKQVDYDGSYAYSPIITVNAYLEKQSDIRVNLYENQYLNFWIYQANTTYDYYIVDMMGRKLLQSKTQTNTDIHKVLNISNFEPGSYLIIFINPSDKQSFRFIKF